MHSELVSFKDVARVLGISVRTLRRWVKAGVVPVPFFRVGPKMLRVRREDLDRYLSNPGLMAQVKLPEETPSGAIK